MQRAAPNIANSRRVSEMAKRVSALALSASGCDGSRRRCESHTYEDMKVTLHHLRKRLKSVGIAIKNTGYARGYHIVFGRHQD